MLFTRYRFSGCFKISRALTAEVQCNFIDALHRLFLRYCSCLLLFLPFVMLVLVFALPFVAAALAVGEVSDAPGGLPYRWLIKATLPLACLLLLTAGFGRLLRVAALLFGAPRAVGGSHRVD